MGASPTTDGRPVPAAVMSTQSPEISVEQADDGDSRVFVEGTMYHDGLNENAWGLTKEGAQAIADDLVGCDYTAAHPAVRGTKYDRSIAEGQGAPIGSVQKTSVVSVDSAVRGGGYTAQYVAEVKDPVFKQKMQAGLFDAEGYGVSIGIYADPETASCSVCTRPMGADECDHQRGETVEAEDGTEEVAGPLYDAGDSDHLAHVWMPAYNGATADVTAASDDGGIASYSEESAQNVLSASTVLGAPYDRVEPAEATTEVAETEPTGPDESSAYHVQVSSASLRRHRDRGSYAVTFNDD